MATFLYNQAGKPKIQGLNSPLFLIGLLVKIIFAALFASNYLVDLFAPFVNYYVGSFFENPYDFFVKNQQPDAFPYPPVMLWILSIPRIIFSPFFTGDYQQASHLSIFVYRIPVLLADIGICIVLLRWLRKHTKQVLWLYWLSPVLFYINYIHGQLDVIPIAILCSSAYFLMKEKLWISAIILGIAISTKTHIVLVIPFFFVYYLKVKNSSLKQAIAYSLLTIAVFIVCNLPFIFNENFILMVFQNTKQIKVFNFYYHFSDQVLFYFTPAAYLALFIRSLDFKSYNKDIFIMFLGFSFGILTIFIPPMQGWYYWIIPFFIYFYIKQKNISIFSFYLLNALYFLYFLIVPHSDYLQVFQLFSEEFKTLPNLYQILVNKGLPANQIVSIVFTLLQTTLLLNCLWIYQRGVKGNIQYKIKYQPYLIGVGGDSGAGKTSFSSSIQGVFGEKNISIIRGDDMHKWERGNQQWQKYTHLNPKANHLHVDMQQAIDLKQGKSIERRHYDHSNGQFTLPHTINSNKVIIFEGLHPFYLDNMRNIYDLKIFISPDENLRLHWKICRDTKKRGYSKEKILNQIKQREDDSQKYIQFQEKYADIVISLCPKEEIKNLGDEQEVIDLYLKIKFENNINVDPLLDYLYPLDTLEIEHYYKDNHQFITFTGNINQATIGHIAFELIDDLEDFILTTPIWQDHYDGLSQLFTLYYVFYKMKLDLHI